jgi:Ni,Fe-hydrogenase maturation factor
MIEPAINDPAESPAAALINAHGMDPVEVLRLARAMGAPTRPLLLIGCEAVPPGALDDMDMGLSEPVQAAVDEAVALVATLAGRLLEGHYIEGFESGSTPQKEAKSCRHC